MTEKTDSMSYSQNNDTHRAAARRWKTNNKAKNAEYQKAYQQRYRKLNKETLAYNKWAYFLSKKYGLTPESFEKLREFQGDACAICRRPFSEVKLVVDHDHHTKEPRGLLCDKCNVGIGRLNDSIELIQKALEYLRNPPCTQSSF